MRRTLGWFAVLVLASAGLYVLLQTGNAGYVLVHAGGYSVETSLIALALGLLGLWVGVRLLRALLFWLNPANLGRLGWFRRWAADPRRASEEGLRLLLLGDWQQAYRLLLESADQVANPAANLLAAALAAYQRGDRAGWQFCLQRAEQQRPALAASVACLRAWFVANLGERVLAVELLHDLQRVLPDQPWVLKQLHDNYLALGDWHGLDNILPALERLQILGSDQLLKAQESVFRQRLADAGNQGEAPLRACWKRVPKALRVDADILTAYLQQLLRLGLDAEAASELTGFLKRQWSDAVVTLVGELSTGDPRQQLALLEKCQKQQPQNPVLLLTLARVSLRNQLWRRARDCLEQALTLAAAPELRARLHTELARLLEQQGEQQQSLEHYRSAVRAVEKQW